MATKAISRRAGTTVEHTSFAGLATEITVDTTKNTLVVHDGETLGGFPLAKENLTNAPEFEGATDEFDGSKGLVKKPLAGDENKVLHGNGSWTYVDWTHIVNEPAIPYNFLDLMDSPSTYSGNAGKLVRVNSTETSLDFFTSEPYYQVKYHVDTNTTTTISSKYQLIVYGEYILEENATLNIQPGGCLIIL
jgi:hypothetical protein